jgi:formylglycine-generating enzyme required for sulfatase activity
MTKIAITIGVQQYQFFRPLRYAANDAEKMRDFLLAEAGFDEVIYYSDFSPDIGGAPTRPTRSNLEFLLEDEFKEPFMGIGDNFWFFFSGHGRRENGIDYLIPSDGFSNVQRSGISVNYIIQQLQKCGADNLVLILDACRDEGDSRKGSQGIGEHTEREAIEKGVITICSCSPNEYSWELEDLQQGAFTYALLEGLGSRGKRATVEKLNHYLKYRVKELSQHKGKQTPRITVDPIEKSHLILMPKYATIDDIATLKMDAVKAERKKELKNAKSLWRMVLNATQNSDKDARDRLTKLKEIPTKPKKIPTKPKEIPKPYKTRRQILILILGGLGGSGFVLTYQAEWWLGKQPTPPDETAKGHKAKIGNKVIIENLDNEVSLEMVKIPGGKFLMGSPETEAERSYNEGPQHNVDVPEFFMGKYAVTQAQWEAVMGNNSSRFKGANRPVETVSWHEATEFCRKLSKITGRKYSLPSESQWEYACRAGTTTPFSFGRTITPELANYNGNFTYGNGSKGKYRKETTNVGIFPPNSFGLYDMHGNVWEWCADEWHNNYDGAPTDGSIWLNGNQNRSLLRGGSWANYPNSCRSAIRNYLGGRDAYSNQTGFRVVCVGERAL